MHASRLAKVGDWRDWLQAPSVVVLTCTVAGISLHEALPFAEWLAEKWEKEAEETSLHHRCVPFIAHGEVGEWRAKAWPPNGLA